MIKKLHILLIVSTLFSSCLNSENSEWVEHSSENQHWDPTELGTRAANHLDSVHWDRALFDQDIATYAKYQDFFQAYPLNKSPFPVAEYDYAVSSIPFIIEIDSFVFKGVRIGEYANPESEKIIDKLTLMVLTNDKEAEETTLVESRNFPYLTAQGTFQVVNNEFDWVFSASPDGYSTLLINMKLFDLRFGETILIYPQKDKSFLYLQIKDSPNNYQKFEDFKSAIKKNDKVIKQLTFENNI